MNFFYDMIDKKRVITEYKKLQKIEKRIVQLHTRANCNGKVSAADKAKIMKEFFGLCFDIKVLDIDLYDIREARSERKRNNHIKASKVSITKLCRDIEYKTSQYLSALKTTEIEGLCDDTSLHYKNGFGEKEYRQIKNVLSVMVTGENIEYASIISNSNDLSASGLVRSVNDEISNTFPKNNLRKAVMVTTASCAAAAVFLTTPVEAPTFTESNGIECDKENDVNELARRQIIEKRRNLLTEKRELLQAASLGMDISVPVLEDTSLRRTP